MAQKLGDTTQVLLRWWQVYALIFLALAGLGALLYGVFS